MLSTEDFQKNLNLPHEKSLLANVVNIVAEGLVETSDKQILQQFEHVWCFSCRDEIPSVEAATLPVLIGPINLKHQNKGFRHLHVEKDISFSRNSSIRTSYRSITTHLDKETEKSPLQNIVYSTELQVQSEGKKMHVSTYAERSAIWQLQQKGSVFLKGRSGSGKTTTGLRILLSVSQRTKRIPVILSSPHQWDNIPKRKTNAGLYVVMIDDVFGVNKFSQSKYDDWEMLFDDMQLCIEAGIILLILTSKPDVYAECSQMLKTGSLLKKTSFFALDEGEYLLTDREKERMAKILCGDSVSMSEKEVDNLKQFSVPIGFPKVCQIFHSMGNPGDRKEIQNKLMKHEVDRIKDSDSFGYFVLMSVILKAGNLEITSPVRAETFMDELKIRTKALTYCGIYLEYSNRQFSFLDKTFTEALVICAFEDHTHLFEFCSAEVLLLVGQAYKKDEQLSESICEMFAGRIFTLLFSDEYEIILDHPFLEEKTFASHMVKQLERDKLAKLCNCKLPKVHKAKCAYPSLKYEQGNTREETVFEYTYLLPYIIMKGLSHFVLCILGRSYNHEPHLFEDDDILTQCLNCAIFISDRDVVLFLEPKGVQFNLTSLKAVCATQQQDLTKNILSIVSSSLEMSTLPYLVNLAALNGNSAVVEYFCHAKRSEQYRNRILGEALVRLFKELNTNCSSARFASLPFGNLPMMLKQFSFSDAKYDFDYLLYLASGHSSATAMQFVLKQKVNVNSKQNITEMFPLHEAALYGSVDCVSVLLENGASLNVLDTNKRSPLHSASMSKIQSEGKIILLFEYFEEDKPKKSDPEMALSASEMKDTDYLKRGDKPQYKRKYEQMCDMKDIFGDAAAHFAARHENSLALKCLIRYNANVDIKNQQDETPLYEAVYKGHMQSVMILCKNGSDVNMKNNFGNTPLICAAIHGQLEIAKVLKLFGSNHSDVNFTGRSCLHEAVINDRLEITRYFICNVGMPVNNEDNTGASLMNLASEFGSLELVQLLYERGASVDNKDNEGKTVLQAAASSRLDAAEKVIYLLEVAYAPLELDDCGRNAIFYAVQSINMEVCVILEEKGMDIKECDIIGNNPLHYACKSTVGRSDIDSTSATTNKSLAETLDSGGYGDWKGKDVDVDLVTFLLSKGLDANAQNKQGQTALHSLAETEKTDGIKVLLDNGSDLHIQDLFGKTALHIATSKGSHEVVKFLIAKGASLNVRDNSGKTALHVACKRHLVDNAVKGTSVVSDISYLIDKGADPNLKDKCGRKALHYAAKGSNVDVVKHLLTCTGVDELDRYGRTLLHYAARAKTSEIVEYFLKVVVLKECHKIHDQDIYGCTALHYACRHGVLESVDKLLEIGLNTDTQNQLGQRAIHFAALGGNVSIVKRLIPKVADIDARDNELRTPLHLACEKGNKHCVLALIEGGSNVSQYDDKGRTPIHHAALGGHNGCIKVLLEKGADRNIQDNDGSTAVHLAIKESHIETLMYFLDEGADMTIKDKSGNTAFYFAVTLGNQEAVRLLSK